jgi:Calpain family cysteine protease
MRGAKENRKHHKENITEVETILTNLVCQNSSQRTQFHGHATATSHRYEGFQEVRDETIWQRSDTAKALQGVPFEEYLGLKFYHIDPVPFILQHAKHRDNLLFIDQEFPTHPSVSVRVDTCTQRGVIPNMIPGILASSNCRDFASAKAKRAERIPRFCQLANKCSWIRMGAKTRLFFALEADNIQQGDVGNCGFCSAFASLVQGWPGSMKEAFGKHSEEGLTKCGAYSIRLFPQGKERYLLLDDYLLRKKSCEPPSLHSRQGDTWTEYLEKAIVKVQGSYASLDGHYKYNSLYRHPARALQLLTGAPIALEFHFDVMNRANSMHEIFEVLLQSEGKYARVAHCRSAHQGLFSNHGYSLLWIGTTNTTNEQIVCLRNPHGCRSYTGKYGYGWEWKGRDSLVYEDLMKLDAFQRIPLGCPQNVGDNGIFLMEFAAFARCFPIVTLVGPIASPDQCARASGSLDCGLAACMYQSQPHSLCHVKALLKAASKAYYCR